jgi:hypothetical protein
VTAELYCISGDVKPTTGGNSKKNSRNHPPVYGLLKSSISLNQDSALAAADTGTSGFNETTTVSHIFTQYSKNSSVFKNGLGRSNSSCSTNPDAL